ncbi:MAG TPA: hypothetical protein VH280_17800 [Verrucomicrobiae bacterium]|jgi:hypothetical protein|nr:hypothetical protein [Verrucomicrobiae bacterium]
MNVQKFWAIKTNELLPRVGTMQAAWEQAGKMFPDAVTLIRVAGATRQSVAQFCNSKIFRGGPPMATDRRREMQAAIEKEIQSRHCDYSAAFNRVYPQFANEAPDPNQVLTQAGADGVPVMGPQLRSLFRLPVHTSQAEWAAAWKANLEKVSPINFGRVFDAICEVAQQEKGMGYEDALRATKSRFPDLWATVEEMAKTVL